jgi:hypothetical protein
LIQRGRLAEVKDMLKDDFRLDLRDVMIQRQHGSCRARKSDFGQVLPRIGEYQVRFITDSLEVPGVLTVGEERLSWQKEFAGTEREIRFLERE